MHIIEVTNVNQALAAGLRYLAAEGVEETSRNGNVVVAPGPVVTVYKRPWERVLFSPTRDANPFFHLMEALWMLAGRNDVKFPALFASNLASYSDDGTTLHGAYGHRWRKWFGYDQLPLLVRELKNKPDSRRCVLAMWDATNQRIQGLSQSPAEPIEEYYYLSSDIEVALMNGKDVPCNTHAYVDIRGGALNLTVCCRSNDIYWGAYGANAVHFSVLQEYLAAQCGVRIGEYRQFSNNYHIYTAVVHPNRFTELAAECEETDAYADYGAKHTPVCDSPDWERDLPAFFDMCDAVLEHGLGTEYQVHRDKLETVFFRKVAVPMFMAYYERKNKLSSGATWVWSMQCSDWQQACVRWIERREVKNA